MHMADRLEALARDVRSFAEEDSDLALQMAAEVRADHLAAQVEAARLQEVEARVEETERRRRAEVEARREVERRKEREEQARLAEDARRAAGIRGSLDASRGPSVQFLAKRERARLQAEKLPTLFDLDALPDEVAGAVLRQMGAYELAATACCNKRFRDLARTDDALWRRLQLTCGRHPRWRVDGSWRESFFQGAEKIDANWRRGKFRRLEHRLHSEYTACVAMRGDLGCSGSADHDLAIFGLPPRARGTPLQGVGLLWERQIGRCVGHGEPVTCCKLAGGDGDDAFSPPTLALSGTAKGEMRVWSLSQMPTCPWRAEEDETWGDMATPGAHDTATPQRVPCVETRLLTTPETGQPHAQFFDVTAGCSLGGNGGDGGSFGLVAAAGAEHGAGVHVYDTARWGAACVRVPGFDAGVTESRGEGVPSTTTWFTPRVPTASSAGGTSALRGPAPDSTPRRWASPWDGTGASRGASTPTGVYLLLVQPSAPFTSTTPGSLTRPSRPPSARTRTASTPWRSTRSSGGW